MSPEDLAAAAAIRAGQNGDTVDTRNIIERLQAVLADRRGLAKEGWNEQQGFRFRSVEQAAAEGRRLFAAHGIALVPRHRVLDDSTYQTKNGTVMRRVMVEGSYLLAAPDGSSVEAVALGESADVMDKATSKAQTMAFKTMLLQLLMVSDPDDDADAHSPAAPVPAEPRQAPRRPAPAIEAALAPINALGSAEARLAAKQRFLVEWGQPADLAADRAADVEAWVEALLDHAAEPNDEEGPHSG